MLRKSTLALVAIATLACPRAGLSETTQEMTPLLLAVHDSPLPFHGSDGKTHLVYELWMTNFSSAEAVIEKVEILGDGTVLQSVDAAEIARRLQPAGLRTSSGTLAGSTQALLFLNVVLASDASIPKQLSHRVSAHFDAAPPGHQEMTESGGTANIDRVPVMQIGPPLAGDRYISADSCCDATRHTRAALPVNGRLWVAQRFAVDWEQLDSENRIYTGDREKLTSYTIFGKPVLAVADATVASITKGLDEQTPGKYPTNIPLDQADGNSIILDLGEHHYALYAHLQSESIHVKRGDKVRLGQIIGLVGNSGNSLAPHLHFHLMDHDEPLASNGLPYQIENFQVIATSPGTEAFDDAEEKGNPLAITPFTPAHGVHDALPLDQQVVSFHAQ